MKLKRIFIFIVIIIVLALLAYYYPVVESTLSGKSIAPLDTNYQKEVAFVTRVVDGDTIHVSINGTDETIRLLGLNTPEHNQPYYQEAKDYLIDEIENKTIELQRDMTDTDKYDRKLRYVFYKDSLVNVESVQAGLATTFMLDGLKYRDKFVTAESFARQNNLKIWQKSKDICADCIKLERLDPKQEFFIINNSCNINCNLKGWFVKDDANHFFYLKDLQISQEEQYDSKQALDSNGKAVKTTIWNNDHDRLFMRDKEGSLVLFYEY